MRKREEERRQLTEAKKRLHFRVVDSAPVARRARRAGRLVGFNCDSM
jgi:hypothetical protein